MDEKFFANVGGPGIMLSIQKNEKITRTVNILKKNLHNFFFTIDIKNFKYGRARGMGMGCYQFQKNQKSTRTIPILK